MEIQELLKSVISGSFPFVIFRNPERDHITVVQQKTRVIYPWNGKFRNGFVMVPFNVNHHGSWIIPYEHSDVWNLTFLPVKTMVKFSEIKTENEGSKEKHILLVKKAIRAIKTGALTKVVVSSKTLLPIERPLNELFLNLCSTYPEAFVFLWSHPKTGIWMGATPETLVNIKKQILKTVSLAGTKSYILGETPKWTAKEYDEQQVVTDFIREQLSKFSGFIEQEGPFDQRTGNLWHLKTIITAHLNFPVALDKLLNTLHPTPAVCGVPRNEAFSFIESQEDYDRAYYTGYLGEMTQNGECHLWVNLRSMYIDDNKAYLLAGGGINILSEPKEEWEEVWNKTKVLGKLL